MIDNEQRKHAEERLAVLEAMVAAFEHRVEVFDVISDSESAEEAVGRLAALLAIPEVHAHAVLDLQSRRFARRERARVIDERDFIRRELDSEAAHPNDR